MVSVWPIGSTDLNLWLITVGNSGMVGLFLAWFLERLPGWANPPKWLLERLSPVWGGRVVKLWPPLKFWGVFAVAVCLPLAFTIVYYQAGTAFISQQQVWGSLVIQGLLLWVSTQAAHVIDPKRLIEFMNVLIKYGPILLALIDKSRASTGSATGLPTGSPADDSVWSELLKRAG